MKIGGLQKLSLIDFPGKISTVVFTQGCNFRCQFCHNKELVLPSEFLPPLEESLFFEFLKKRKGQIEAVVISGGEPTIHDDLPDFIKKIKKCGFLVKLDTNGTNPLVIQKLYDENLLDYIAVDIKHAFEKYNTITNASVDIEKIKKSVRYIMSGNVDYEFRTTVVPQFHSVEVLKTIATQINGAKRFILQEFLPDNAMNKSLVNTSSIFLPEKKKLLSEILEFFKTYVLEVSVRKVN